MKKIYKDIAVFVGGTLFGSAGIKLLSSKDAKNVYIPMLPQQFFA